MGIAQSVNIYFCLACFIPFALMMAEMGSAYRKEEGGIYSWMNNSVGPRYAFIGTFTCGFHRMSYGWAKYGGKIWVPFSTFVLAPI